VQPIELRYTRQQLARAARPDATDGGAGWMVLKRVSSLRLTYQIRLLTFQAVESGARLTIRVPQGCRISGDLRAFMREHKASLRVQRVAD
jgi:hypothetical protein